jgi:hypothetical protein
MTAIPIYRGGKAGDPVPRTGGEFAPIHSELIDRPLPIPPLCVEKAKHQQVLQFLNLGIAVPVRLVYHPIRVDRGTDFGMPTV